jgi:hypothetical protein
MQNYNQRPFDKTVCDALITNGDVIKPLKRYKTFAMAETTNMFHIIVACAMHGILFAMSLTIETGSQMKLCAIYVI